jgi:glutamine synthetase type III
MKSRNLGAAAAVTVAAAISFGIPAAAHGASDIWYAYQKPMSQGQHAESGYGGTNVGGEGFMNATFGGKLYIRTRGDNSGYVYGGIDIPNHARVRYSHLPVALTHGDCWWGYGITIQGTTAIDCARTRQ